MPADVKQKNYKFPVQMVVALRKMCKANSLNESAFVRQAIAEKMQEYGIVVDHELQHGGIRESAK